MAGEGLSPLPALCFDRGGARPPPNSLLRQGRGPSPPCLPLLGRQAGASFASPLPSVCLFVFRQAGAKPLPRFCARAYSAGRGKASCLPLCANGWGLDPPPFALLGKQGERFGLPRCLRPLAGAQPCLPLAFGRQGSNPPASPLFADSMSAGARGLAPAPCAYSRCACARCPCLCFPYVRTAIVPLTFYFGISLLRSLLLQLVRRILLALRDPSRQSRTSADDSKLATLKGRGRLHRRLGQLN